MSSIYRQAMQAASETDHHWSLPVRRKQYSWPLMMRASMFWENCTCRMKKKPKISF